MAGRKRSTPARRREARRDEAGKLGDSAGAGKTLKVAKPDLPGPGTDEFAFLVATYAWRDGLTANAIVRRLKLPSKPQYLMQVKRALKRAHGRFFRLVPPPSSELQRRLHDVVNKGKPRTPIRFHVVDDQWGPVFGPVCAGAGILVTDIIRNLLRESIDILGKGRKSSVPHDRGSDESDLVICNAGGRTISEVVKSLLRSPPLVNVSEDELLCDTRRLVFVAGNAAYLPDQFQRSANFLSVTMAELFSAGHLALPMVEDVEFPRQYRHLVDQAALFICGVGTPESSLMGKYFSDRGWEMPKRAVGDLAFNLIDECGDAVDVPDVAADFMRQVNPVLNLPKLAHIAANNRVVLVLDSEQPESKARISIAVLQREYVTDVVLGTRLASTILRMYPN